MSRHYRVLRSHSIFAERDLEAERAAFNQLKAISPEVARKMEQLDWVSIRRACVMDALKTVASEFDGSISHPLKGHFGTEAGKRPKGELLGTINDPGGLVAVYFHEGTLQLAWAQTQYASDARLETALHHAQHNPVPEDVKSVAEKLLRAYRVEMAACAVQIHTGRKPTRTVHEDGSVTVASVPQKVGGRS